MSRWLVRVLVAPWIAGCAGDDTNPSVPPSDAGRDVLTVDATTGAGDSGDAAPGPAQLAVLRVANWSPDSPAIDFCLADHGTTSFRAPLLGALARTDPEAGAAGDGGSPALMFPQVSSYFSIAPGQYDARVVAAGAIDCATGIGADLTTLPELRPGSVATLALGGDAHPSGAAPGLALVGYMDDTKPKGPVGLRFINAAPSLAAASFGMGTLASGFKPLFLDVPFGQAGSPPDAGPSDASVTVDPNGYESTQPLSLATLSAHAVGATVESATASDVSAAAGSLLTIVLIGSAPGTLAEDSGNGGEPVQLLECVDNAGTVGLLSECRVVSH